MKTPIELTNPSASFEEWFDKEFDWAKKQNPSNFEALKNGHRETWAACERRMLAARVEMPSKAEEYEQLTKLIYPSDTDAKLAIAFHIDEEGLREKLKLPGLLCDWLRSQIRLSAVDVTKLLPDANQIIEAGFGETVSKQFMQWLHAHISSVLGRSGE